MEASSVTTGDEPVGAERKRGQPRKSTGSETSQAKCPGTPEVGDNAEEATAVAPQPVPKKQRRGRRSNSGADSTSCMASGFAQLFAPRARADVLDTLKGKLLVVSDSDAEGEQENVSPNPSLHAQQPVDWNATAKDVWDSEDEDGQAQQDKDEAPGQRNDAETAPSPAAENKSGAAVACETAAADDDAQEQHATQVSPTLFDEFCFTAQNASQCVAPTVSVPALCPPDALAQGASLPRCLGKRANADRASSTAQQRQRSIIAPDAAVDDVSTSTGGSSGSGRGRGRPKQVPLVDGTSRYPGDSSLGGLKDGGASKSRGRGKLRATADGGGAGGCNSSNGAGSAGKCKGLDDEDFGAMTSEERARIMEKWRRFAGPAGSPDALRLQVLIAAIIHPKTSPTVVLKRMSQMLEWAQSPCSDGDDSSLGPLTAERLAAVDVQHLEKLFDGVHWHRVKAKRVRDAAKALTGPRFNGRVPADRGELLQLPGVGPRLANLLSFVIGEFDREGCEHGDSKTPAQPARHQTTCNRDDVALSCIRDRCNEDDVALSCMRDAGRNDDDNVALSCIREKTWSAERGVALSCMRDAGRNDDDNAALSCIRDKMRSAEHGVAVHCRLDKMTCGEDVALSGFRDQFACGKACAGADVSSGATCNLSIDRLGCGRVGDNGEPPHLIADECCACM